MINNIEYLTDKELASLICCIAEDIESEEKREAIFEAAHRIETKKRYDSNDEQFNI